MGNSLTSCALAPPPPAPTLRVIKLNDDKVIEFTSPITVKDLLSSHPNFYVGLFREATQPLPLHYKLKHGKVYYLLPSPSTSGAAVRAAGSGGGGEGGKRVKVILTKQQLEELLNGEKRRSKLESIDEDVQSVCEN